MTFLEELRKYAGDERTARLAARHLDLIAEANQQFNLTRIVSPAEAAVKHTVDSLHPVRFFAGAKLVADAGSGAGFPGIPLAIALPDTRFVLLESTQKKARFIEAAARELDLPNVEVAPVRAEDWLKSNRCDIVTARAVAPLARAMPLFAPALKRGARVLLYKGPDIEKEIAELPVRDRHRARVVDRYELPAGLGSRTIVELLLP